MSGTRLVFLGSLLALLPIIAAGQETSPDHGTFLLDEVLKRNDSRHGTLGPTGRRISADRIEEKPGLQGTFSYLHHTPGFNDPIELSFRGESGPLVLKPAKTTWRPSHLEVQWTAGDSGSGDNGLFIVEKKFITEDDALVDRVQVINRSPHPVSIEALARGSMTPGVERFRSQQIHIDLSRSANLPPFPGHRLFTSRPDQAFVWFEGEEFLFQHGSPAVERLADASGGLCLGSGFGSREGHQVLYALFCPGIEKPSFCLRYARSGDGDARFLVEIDGSAAGIATFPPTGRSGESPGPWKYARFVPGSLAPGLHKIAFKARHDKSEIRLDGFFVLPADQEPPALPESGRFPAGMEEQIPYLPGSIDYDGVRYLLPDPGEEMKPVLVALQGGIEGDPAFSRPLSITVDPPDLERGARTAFHLLAALAGPRGFRSGPPAFFTFVMDDGSMERVPFPDILDRLTMPGAEPQKAAPMPVELDGPLGFRAAWRFLVLPLIGEPCVQLSYEPPPGRSVRRIIFEKGSPGGPEVPLLLAGTVEILPSSGRLPVHVGHETFHEIPVALALAGTDFVAPPMAGGERVLLRSLQIEPGACQEFTLVLVTGRKATEAVWEAVEKAEEPDPLGRHVALFGKWFDDHVPTFSCSDRWMEKLWHYRWFLVRHNMARPGAPPLTAPVFFEGRHGSPYLQATPFSSSRILAEVRWLREKRFAVGQVRAFLRTMQPDGRFSCVRLDRQEGQTFHSVPAAALGVFRVHDEPQYLKEILSLVARNVDGTAAGFDGDRDGLPALRDHRGSGMAWQPSFFFFNGYDRSRPATSMERPDLAAYLFASCRAVAEGYGFLGDREKAAAYRAMAEKVRAAALTVLWDGADRFFYAVREGDNRMARCREAAGFVPFALGLCPMEQPYTEAFDFLFDEKEFWTSFPPATAARSVPVFSAVPGSWPGSDGEPFALTTNGSAWPHVQDLAAEAMARALRSGAATTVTPPLFAEFLRRHTRLQFEEGDFERPLTRECYDSRSGAPYGCIDHLSSAYNDLLIRFVGGVVPSTGDELLLFPVVRHLDHFRFRGLRYHGRDLEIVWIRPGTANPFPGQPEGFSVLVDGKRKVLAPELGKVTVEL